MANLVAMLRLPGNLKSTQWQILAGPDSHPANSVDDGFAASGVHPRPAFHIQHCVVHYGFAGGDVHPAHP